jgi:CDP-glycerol glycerophosphotransferase
MGVQLYQFISMADVMISDYSSISIDFLLKDKPIVFTLDDYKEYDKSRGLFPKNAIDYMKGYHVYNQKELEESISEIAEEVDTYKDDRDAIMKDYHTYTDGNSSKRILDTINIKLERGGKQKSCNY